MRAAVADDMNDSARVFLDVVWPSIRPWFGGGEVIPVETVTDDRVARLLDMASGIDAWHYRDDAGLRGVASRVQFDGNPWNTFTIRYARDSGAETEYVKRLRARHTGNGWLNPHLWVHAYVDGRQASTLVSVAVIRTRELLDFAETAVADLTETGMSHRLLLMNGSIVRAYGFRRTGNAVFLYLDWSWLKAEGADVRIIDPRDGVIV